MILVISTSSSVSSVAWFQGGELLWSAAKEAPRSASQAILELVEESGIPAAHAAGFVADLGPGSMTGVKVGVTLAKTWAFALGARCAGLAAFDLIDHSRPVIISPRRNEHCLRVPDQAPVILTTQEAEEQGWSELIRSKAEPLAERAGPLIEDLDWMAPEALVPLYMSAPLISQSKKKPTHWQEPKS